MNLTPIPPDQNDRAELARLLPGPVERELPSDRHRHLQEFVMSEIHQDLRATGQVARPTPRRRFALAASALTAVAATAVGAVAIGTAGSEPPPTPPVTAALSGQQILLAAASTAERLPESSGNYWYVRITSSGTSKSAPWQVENWFDRSGRTWLRGDKSNGQVVELSVPTPFQLGGSEITVARLRMLPTSPEALREWLTDAVRDSDVRTSAGRPTVAQQERLVFDGLISLVSQLPAPPKVRAAAFQAIAAYPDVESLGAVDGGQGLLVPFGTGSPARLVVDPVTSRIRQTNFFVSVEGGQYVAGGSGADAGSFTLVAEWTDELPR
ncbi:CU044_5270 family protein [Plantactinospora sonchi]|uniref:CU044_5270 family protein n=1 Tax=Plantactinospora sonchi TaxID=1544735 RepID=A0ABU7S233_9ACTN